VPDDARRRSVAVIIPARDEAATIGFAVDSLRAQNWTGLIEVIVVDDDSSDLTAEIARAHGATVIAAGSLPPGWTGKMWALSRGVARAISSGPDYLLFTDADIVHGPSSVTRLIAEAETEHRDLVSVMVKLRCDSFAERLLMPAFVFFFFMLYPPAWIPRRDRRTAGAAGGCVLMRPSALQSTGGIDGIRAELIDDCALAAAVKRSGGSVWLGLTEETHSLRAYSSFADVRQMIARTAFTQLRYSVALLAGTIAGMLFLYAVPVFSAAIGSATGALAWVLMSALYLPMIRFYRLPAPYALLLPFVAVFYLIATIESAVCYWRGKGGNWKGRHQILKHPADSHPHAT
jgi:hopene-associated glycosyltransferase HpnB